MILLGNLKNRRTFNIRNRADVAMFKEFMINNGWGAGGCPFELEYPYSSVPDMIKDKLIRKMLKLPDMPLNSFKPKKGESNVHV